MADSKPTIFDIETLNATAARLLDHADTITNAARRDVAADLRLAARIASAMATLRFRVGEAASATKDPKTAERLLDLLKAVED